MSALAFMRRLTPWGRAHADDAVAADFLAGRLRFRRGPGGALQAMAEAAEAKRRQLSKLEARVVELAGVFAFLAKEPADNPARRLAAARLGVALDMYVAAARAWPDLAINRNWDRPEGDAQEAPAFSRCCASDPDLAKEMASWSAEMRRDLARYGRQAAECPQPSEPRHEG